MTTTMKEWPEVVDEKVDDKFWTLLQNNIELMLKTKAQNEKMHCYVHSQYIEAEKSSVPKPTDIALILSMPDPKTEAAAEIKGYVPFLVKTVDDTVTVDAECPLDFEYPDLQNLIYNLFEPAGELKPGVQLIVRKKDEK